LTRVLNSTGIPHHIASLTKAARSSVEVEWPLGLLSSESTTGFPLKDGGWNCLSVVAPDLLAVLVLRTPSGALPWTMPGLAYTFSALLAVPLLRLHAALRNGLLLQTDWRGLSVCLSVTTVSPATAVVPIVMSFRYWLEWAQGTIY